MSVPRRGGPLATQTVWWAQYPNWGQETKGTQEKDWGRLQRRGAASKGRRALWALHEAGHSKSRHVQNNMALFRARSWFGLDGGCGDKTPRDQITMHLEGHERSELTLWITKTLQDFKSKVQIFFPWVAVTNLEEAINVVQMKDG